MASDEIRRIVDEYSRRATDVRLQGLYSVLRPGSLHMAQSLERALLKAFRTHGVLDFSDLTVLDVGCGEGHNLWQFIGYGFQAMHCSGIDLLPDRIARARQLLPGKVTLLQGDASRLPFGDSAFDIVTQFTVFSSILSEKVCAEVSREMLRVLRPGGLVLSYDFWLNPSNNQTRGIKPGFLRSLFPGAELTFYRITLAPPLVRRIAPCSWAVATLLEALRIFNTHYLAVIEKVQRRGSLPIRNKHRIIRW
jgi:ubiquinone/menaquinone biosynthesis C-methylase UbiE